MFNFLKGAGAAIFGGGKANADSIKKHILETLMPQGNRLENLAVQLVDESCVTLFGACDTVKTKEKAILIAGNIEGITLVDGNGLTVPQAAPTAAPTVVEPTPTPVTATPQAPLTPTAAAPEAPAARKIVAVEHEASADTQAGLESQFYTIQKGDTLSQIAKKFYGSASKYTYIVEENTGVITNPDRIYAGQVIRIPAL